MLSVRAAYLGPHQTTVDGYDLCMQVNFLSVFHLSNLFVLRHTTRGTVRTTSAATKAPISSGNNRTELFPFRPSSTQLRIVNVSSDSYSRGRLHLKDLMSPAPGRGIFDSYADSKLAMMLFTAELNIRHSPDGVTCLAAHPGT